ncbi:MAG: SRPBCC family protein [Mycobacterium sp.]
MDEPLDVSHLRLRSRIRVACTPSEAYDLISDVGAMASWSSELVCARYDDGHGPSWWSTTDPSDSGPIASNRITMERGSKRRGRSTTGYRFSDAHARRTPPASVAYRRHDGQHPARTRSTRRGDLSQVRRI